MSKERIRIWDNGDLAVFCDEKIAWAEDHEGNTHDIPREFINAYLRLEVVEHEARKVVGGALDLLNRALGDVR